ncbi:MAG: M20/M25/M40 family metallo-hydrolase [Rhodanobacteraceae bacterium]
MKPEVLFMLVAMLSSAMVRGADSGPVWLTVDQPVFRQLQSSNPGLQAVAVRQVDSGLRVRGRVVMDTIEVVRVSALQRDELAQSVHQNLHHCAGFFAYDSLAAALASLAPPAPRLASTRPAYSIDHQSLVDPMLAQMSADPIAATIVSLSAFPNRYYNGSHGAAAADALVDLWSQLAGSRNDVHVEKVFRGTDAMPSVVLTINGRELSEQVVVLGAHLDSVNWHDRGGASHNDSVAPGADDDASGVAGLTEILRQLMASGYQPQRSIQLMAYSGEEFGLYGSSYLAGDYASRAVDVVGVLQLDMTNYKGSSADIYLIDDQTDAQQNQFLEQLVAAYLPAVQVARDTCGYACSDHASWTQQGYPASFPFEASISLYQDNPYIHSSKDTYANSGSQADDALKFTRLGLAYAVELGELSDHIFDDGMEFTGGSL